jgi:hypothetical protein
METPDPIFRKAEFKNDALHIDLESEIIVRYYIEHMKTLFDSIDGADNFYTLSMKFGSDEMYSITFQKHPGKTPAEEIGELKAVIKELTKKK